MTRNRRRAVVALAAAVALLAPAGPAHAAPGWTTLLKDPSIGFVTALHAASARSLWAFVTVEGTQPNTDVTQARHWDGKKWRTYPLPVNGHVSSADSSSPSDVWAYVSPVPDQPETGAAILHWDGRSWTVSHRPRREQASESLITALGKGRAVTTVFTPKGTRVLTRSGGRWTGRTASGLGLSPVWPLSTRNMWALGDRLKGSGNEYVHHFDGAKWRRRQPPKALLKMGEKECLRIWPGLPRSECPTGWVSALVPHSAKNVLAVVRFMHPTELTTVLRWNGSRWVRVPGHWPVTLYRTEADGKGGFWAVGGSDDKLVRHYRAGVMTRVAAPKGAAGMHGLSVAPSGRVFVASSYGYVWTRPAAR
ncbi:hypothetical protein [Actinocorallia sp. A-T 12471]|uniref:hypothetical protein n=1 Tax=Actinocorallia sp. A-T 12471 TaxID=3089813 RepID=UPI0029CB3413|nr:hypothetical protein [Actinocorallia sp. A-T 12471]MDX6743443.1 hypothetical protein [Actinocorallia sp. A-T 12471]